MPFTHQKPRAADFLLSEGNGQRSRENATLAPTKVPLYAGQLLTRGADKVFVPYAGPGKGNPVLTADAILYAGAPASERPQAVVVISREATVSTQSLIGLDDPGRATLQAAGILARD